MVPSRTLLRRPASRALLVTTVRRALPTPNNRCLACTELVYRYRVRRENTLLQVPRNAQSAQQGSTARPRSLPMVASRVPAGYVMRSVPCTTLRVAVARLLVVVVSSRPLALGNVLVWRGLYQLPRWFQVPNDRSPNSLPCWYVQQRWFRFYSLLSGLHLWCPVDHLRPAVPSVLWQLRPSSATSPLLCPAGTYGVGVGGTSLTA